MVVRVLVTGAAGQIGYAVVLQIAKGDVFGPETVNFFFPNDRITVVISTFFTRSRFQDR